MKQYLLLILLSCSFLVLKGQNIEADLLKMNETYSQLENFAIQIRIEMDLEMQTAFPIDETYMYKKGTAFFVKMGSIEQIKNERCRLVIHHDEKQMGYHPADTISLNDVIEQSFEEVIQKGDLSSFEFIREKEGQKHYKLRREDEMIQEMGLYLNAENHLLEKLVYQYHPDIMGENQKVTIYYENNLKPSFKNIPFDEGTYVLWDKEDLKLQPKYQSYNLIQLKLNDQ